MRTQTIEDVVRKGHFVRKGTMMPPSHEELIRTVDLSLPGKCAKDDILEELSTTCFSYENDPSFNCFAIEFEYKIRWGRKYFCVPWRFYHTQVTVTYEVWQR